MVGSIEPLSERREQLLAKARQLGEDAARGLSASWPEAEVMLQRIWHQAGVDLCWDEAHEACYAGWLNGKAALMDEHTPPVRSYRSRE